MPALLYKAIYIAVRASPAIMLPQSAVLCCAVILVWEEVWDLPDNAALSSWLLLLITAGAMIGSWHFERRIWCRYKVLRRICRPSSRV
jgi:polyferredoxin